MNEYRIEFKDAGYTTSCTIVASNIIEAINVACEHNTYAIDCVISAIQV